MGDYNITNLYQGGYSSFKPNYNSGYASNLVNYHTKAGTFGTTTDPRTANLLQEVSGKLNMGIKNIEITAVSPLAFDSIPEPQLDEVRRLAELTGVKPSVHGPVIDTIGIDKEGFSELNREASERRIIQTLNRVQKLDPKGNIPVTFHSAEGIPGSDWKTLGSKDKPREAKSIVAIDKETGKMTKVKYEEKFYPEDREGKIGIRNEQRTPLYQIDLLNATEWDNKLDQTLFNKERADEILRKNYRQIDYVYKDIEQGKFDYNNLTPPIREALDKVQTAHAYLDDVKTTVYSEFSKAYKYGDEKQREILTQIAENYSKEIANGGGDLINASNAMQHFIYNLKTHELAPKMFVPIEEFAVEQSSKTFANAALSAYKKFGENNAPMISIENPPAGFGLSTGEDLKNLVEASREKFAKSLINEGKSEREAKKTAEKLIGATWDVGHINMLKKDGFKDEDIIKETEKIAPFVKHVHLSDNFGFEHTELPMGMGDVPIAKIMEKLGERGVDARKIIEAQQWWEHFKTPMLKETMEAFGSPIYSGGGNYWNQNLGLHQEYYGGLGASLPQVNYETFGSNFSRLPMELGGQRQGAEGSRMSGRGME